MALNFYYNKIYETFEASIPTKIKNISNRIYPVWYNLDLIKNIKLKYNLHKKYKVTKSPSDYEAFSQCRKRVKAEIASSHFRYRDRVQSHLAKDPKSFWNYVNSKKDTSRQHKLIKEGRVLSGGESAKEFARFFHSVYSVTEGALSAEAACREAPPSSAYAHLACLERKDVRRALTCLPPKRSVGPDGIPPFILRDCGMVLIEPLLHLFNVCLSAAHFPSLWKLTRVVPIPKGRGGTDVSDFRPIAVLSAPAKVFEMAVHNCLYPQIGAHLSDAQHGFRPGCGTTGNLLHLMTQLVPAVDAGLQVDVAYLDFKKAFDTVNHDILLSRLAGMGCTYHTIKFFASYLRDRRQYVDCAGHFSEPYYTRSGVSQGTNLGPLLFIIMVNDLPNIVKAKCLLFADDLKLSVVIKDATDHDILQHDLDRVTEWSHCNKLYFNVSKCSVLSFTRTRIPLHHQYIMDGKLLQRVMEVKDLGINFTCDLQFRNHVVQVCKKAYRNLGFVLRQANDFTNISALKALYEALVRSHLEYGAAIWSPSEIKYKFMLERIQNKFIRFMYLKLYGVYPGYPLLYPTLFCLGMVGYYKLEVRREVALATYIFKVLRGSIQHSGILSEIGFSLPDGYMERRRRPRLLVVPCARTNLLERAPLTRALCTLNTVADAIDIFTCSLSEFTRATYYLACKIY